MADGIRIQTAPVNQKMHCKLGRWFVFAANFPAVTICDYQIVGVIMPLQNPRGVAELRPESRRMVILPLYGEWFRARRASFSGADVEAMLNLRLLMAGRNVIGTHLNF